jgi:glycosyltransferase 2 family protein
MRSSLPPGAPAEWMQGHRPRRQSFYLIPPQGDIITRKKWRWAASAAVIAIVTLAAIRLRGQVRFEWSIFIATFYQLDFRWLALACVLAYATYVGRALRWAVFLKPVRPRPDMWNLIKATIIGFTAVVLLGRPGEFVRPYLIAVKEGAPLTSQLAAWFLERLFDLLFALSIFGYGLSRMSASRAQVSGALQWAFEAGGSLVWILSAISLGILILLRRFPEIFRERLLAALGFLHEHHMARAEKLINTFLQGVESLRSVKSVLVVVGLTALEWTLIGGSYLCILKSFGGIFQFNLIDIFIYMGFVAFGTVVQLPGIGGGMQVVSVLVLHEIFGIPVELATSMTLVIWIITFVILLPVGMPLALHEGLNWRKLRAIREESSL